MEVPLARMLYVVLCFVTSTTTTTTVVGLLDFAI
jgi:hypothetical protein